MTPAADHPQCRPLGLAATMARLTRQIEGHTGEQEMLDGILDVVLDVFDCDRAWLLHMDAETPNGWRAVRNRTRPDWPGAFARDELLVVDKHHADLVSECLRLERPVADIRPDAVSDLAALYGVRSQLVGTIAPRGRRTMLFGLHHCRQACAYDEAGELFIAVAARIADALAASRALAELRQSEERFRTLVEYAPEAIVILDVDSGHFIDANRGAAKLFGVEPSDMLHSKGPVDFSPELQPGGEPSAETAMKRIRAALGGQPQVFEWVHRNAAGQDVPCDVSLVHLPHPTRRLVRGSMTDIGTRKQAERERAELEAKLVQAQKLEAVGQLTGGVAHDFNNLLTVIMGNAELALQFGDDSETVDEALVQIQEAAGRASSLTARLLAFSRRQPLRPQALDLARLLRGMDDMLRRTLGEDVAFELVVAGGVWSCEADPSQLENAILNLCVNARDAMPGGGRLTIECGNSYLDDDYAVRHGEVQPGQYVVVSVSDDGCGMQPDVLSTAFEPFFTTKDVGRGSGLGLSMVYGFVKQSGGHVKIYSEVGEGTTVKLYLPRASEDAHALEAPREVNGVPQGAGQTILVVEDAADVRQLACTMLESLGYTVVSAGDANEALGVLGARSDIALLFTDVVLPGGTNGVDLAGQARELRPGLRVLYTSGYTANAIIHNGRLDRGVRLVEKPFTRRTLAVRVADALAADEPAD